MVDTMVGQIVLCTSIVERVPVPFSLAASFSRTNHASFVWVTATRCRWVGLRDDRGKAHLGEENSALKLRLEGQRRTIHELEHQAYTLREEARVR